MTEVVVTRNQKAQKNKKDVVAADVQDVMRMPQGRRFMRRLIEGTGFWNDTLTTDDRSTTIRGAKRQVGIAIWSDLGKFAPNERDLMMQEHTKEKS